MFPDESNSLRRLMGLDGKLFNPSRAGAEMLAVQRVSRAFYGGMVRANEPYPVSAVQARGGGLHGIMLGKNSS
jgi:hypothetical protein